MHLGLPERDGLELVRDLALHRVQRPVLEEDDRVVVVDRRPEQPAHVLGRRREHDLEPGHVDEPRLQLLRVLRARRPARSTLRADRERHLQLATRHRPVLRRLVDELLHGEREEVLVHDLDDRPHPLHGRADPAADDRHLRDGRVADAPRAELVEEALRDGHRAAHLRDVLAHDEDALVLPQRPRERVAHRLAIGQLRHRRASGRLPARDRCPPSRARRTPRPRRRSRASSASKSSSESSSRARRSSIGSFVSRSRFNSSLSR